MPKVNQKKISDQIQEIIIKQLLYTVTSLESPKQAASFLSDFLTDAETIMLSKRLAISILLIRGHSQTIITKMLSVSYSATGAVKSWLKNADPSTLVMLNTASQAEEWREIVYNYKVLNQKNKSKRGRKPKNLNTERITQIDDPQEASSPASDDPVSNKTPDFETLEGPELVIEDTKQDNSSDPSMEDLLNSE